MVTLPFSVLFVYKCFVYKIFTVLKNSNVETIEFPQIQ